MSKPLESHTHSLAQSDAAQNATGQGRGSAGSDSFDPPDKPIRLALACNQCRKRKVRCDAQHPKCRNCSLRGDVCETSDPRKPGNYPAVRRRASRHGQNKRARRASDRTLSPSTGALPAGTAQVGPVSVSSINSVLNPTAPAPVPMSVGVAMPISGAVTGSAVTGVNGPWPELTRGVSSAGNYVSPSVGGSSKSPAVNGSNVSTVSPANSSWRTTQSERLGEDHYSWQSRAYEETHGQEIVDNPETEGEPQEPGNGGTHSADEADSADDVSRPRTKHLGASSVQCLFNFVDLHLAQLGFKHDTPLFKHGMLHTEEFPLPIIPHMPDLPDQTVLKSYLDIFFARIWPVYPVLDRKAFETDINTVFFLQTAREAWPGSITLSHVPTLVSIYAITSLGLIETSDDSDASFDYLTASHSLHGHLVAVPYTTSVQALFLLALGLRAIAKDGQAWHIIGQAIRMAQSIGLHKSAKRHMSGDYFTLGPEPEGLRERLWWSLFGMEKLMQLECGRPSIIDRSYDSLQVLSDHDSSDSAHQNRYFRAWVGLATLMGNISHRLYTHKFMGGSAEMLGAVAQLDLELSEWENSLPEDLKPRRALVGHAGPDHHIITTFLSQQYHHAQLSILRVSIIFPQYSISQEIHRHSPQLPILKRVLDGAITCANAARTIVTQSLQLEDRGLKSTLLSISPTYLAAVILALGALRQPTSRLVRSDVELLASATEYVEAWFSQRGFGPAFTQTCVQLRERVAYAFASPRCDDDRGTHQNQHLARRAGEPRGPAGDSSGMGPFGGFGFEELWNLTDLDFMVYGEENAIFPS
ncbi:hypothetical protein PDE_06180 [Penicillium oxalicum 114-2]|uniref:Zn(2)-C6 fungal-type domain-containing protein n=1 Tax=Penicillium oxalicum (strain 114-2 / CGMCC 5302) TaxID=933388 RepID=S7ZKR1_PENO1|nr:hypothetical protein PDE_06180 [Penicillium oxalicum 114-2]